MSSSINKNVNVERRTWDKETYEARARSRASAEDSSDLPHPTAKSGATEETPEEFQHASSDRAGPEGSQRAFLKSRSNRVDLTSKLGSVEIIDPKAAANVGGSPVGNGVTKCSDGVGWHCRVCDCFLKDSLTYLDHINGKKHQRYLGYSMRVEKSTAEDVGGVLKGLAEKRNDDSEEENVVESVDFEEVVLKREEDAARRKKERAKRREERKRRLRGEDVAGDDKEKNDGNSANNNHADDNPANDNPTNETENVVDEGDAADEEEEEEDDGGMDPNLAAMMGFSGFGGSRKK